MANVNTKELVIKEKTGTWSQSRKLLMECENNHNNGYAMKYSKNLNNVYKLMRWLEESNKKALIHVLQGGRDYSNGGVRWDGVDFVTRGVNHPKAKGEGGISITKILWDDLIENWFPTSDSCFEYPTGISNTKDSCANNIPFLKANSTDIERQIQAQQIKNDCSNLWQVTETLLETEGTGKFNKGNILNKATAVIGKTIFWGTNNTDPKNKGYSWKYLLTSGWFKL